MFEFTLLFLVNESTAGETPVALTIKSQPITFPLVSSTKTGQSSGSELFDTLSLISFKYASLSTTRFISLLYSISTSLFYFVEKFIIITGRNIKFV